MWYHTSALLSAVKRMWEKYIMNKESEEKKREKINQKKWQHIWVSNVWVTSDESVWVSIFIWVWYTHTHTHHLSQCMDASKQLPWIMLKFNDTHINTHSWTMLGDGDPKWHQPERQGALFGYCHSTKTPEGEAPPRPCASLIQNKGWEKRHC